MHTLYLKAADEAALWQALEDAGLVKKNYSEFDEEGNPVGDFEWQQLSGYDLDIIGVIYKPTGEMLTDAEGSQYPAQEQLDGYHANIRLWSGEFTADQIAALPTIDAPSSPVRIWG